MTKIFKTLALAATMSLTGVLPMSAQSSSDPVILINPFVVPAGSEDDAIAMWMLARDFLATSRDISRPDCIGPCRLMRPTR